MSLYEFKKVNATTAIYKDTNDPANEGYRLTDAQWREVKALDGNYNEQIALAAVYDAENRQRTDADEQAMDFNNSRDAGDKGQSTGGYR